MVLTLRNCTTGEIVARRVARAAAPWARALGYLARRAVAPDEGLLFENCTAVHTFGLRAALDVVFVDAERTVVRVVARAARNRIERGGAGAAAVIELGTGGAARIRPGDRLQLE